MIKALIFDLDNCLAAAAEVGDSLYEPAFAAMRQNNHGTLTDEQLARAFADCWRHPLDWVAAHHGFTAEMLEAGLRASSRLEVSKPMRGYGDLAVLGSLPVLRFLVTSGFRRLQESKIRALNIEAFFDAIYVDAIDEPDRPGKQKLFEQIIRERKLAKDEVLIIGDNEESELAAGRRIGVRTVQTLRAHVPRSEQANFHIRTLHELPALLKLGR